MTGVAATSTDNSSIIASTNKTVKDKTEVGTFDFFLKMLTTQLKNQDPTEPMDVSQMSAQIAQYSSVEQQVKTNDRLDQLLKSNKASELSTAVSYISREVESIGNTGSVLGGQGGFSYVLPKPAQNVEITITDLTGRAVFKGTGTTKQGTNLVVWDGVNSFTGQREADGTYRLSVSAKDASGAAVTAEPRAVGIVQAVKSDKDGNVVLTVGDQDVKFSDVLAVRVPTRAQI